MRAHVGGGRRVVSPIKFGGLATHQARRAAAAIARLAGVEDAPDPGEPVLHGRLMVGRRMRRLSGRGDAEGAPLWWPQGKVAGEYLPRWLTEHGVAPPAAEEPTDEGITSTGRSASCAGRSWSTWAAWRASSAARIPRSPRWPSHARGPRALSSGGPAQPAATIRSTSSVDTTPEGRPEWPTATT